jgi:hypothetical protein
MSGIPRFQKDQVAFEFVVQRLPGGNLTLAKDANGQKAWGAHANGGPVQYFPLRGIARKALKQNAVSDNGGSR